MGLKSFFEKLLSTPPVKVNFRRMSDEKLRGLWRERSELTEQARAALAKEVERRGWNGPAEPEPTEPAPAAASSMTFVDGALGELTVRNGQDEVVFNQPRSDDDGRPRSADGLAVAMRFLDACGERPLELPTPMTFMDAAMLAARAGQPQPRYDDARREALAALCWAAVAGDSDGALAGSDAPWMVPCRNAVLARTDPLALLEVQPTHLTAIVRGAEHDEAAAHARLAAMAEMELADPVRIEATLVAMDRGLDPAPFLRRWPAPDSIEDEDRAHLWRAAEVRRAARVDLERALDLEWQLPGQWKFDQGASIAVSSRLAETDPAEARARLSEMEPDLDRVGWLGGVAFGGADAMGAALDRWVEHLGPMTYDPHFFMLGVLEACIQPGDTARAQRLLERGGPTGWQVAHAAHDALARSAHPAMFLPVLLEPYPPGTVAGRAVDRNGMGFAVGKAVIRPAWLDFAEPHPVETLSVTSALAGEGPIWSWPWRP